MAQHEALYDQLLESIGHWPQIRNLQAADVHTWLREANLHHYVKEIATAVSAESALKSVIAGLWDEPDHLLALTRYLLKYVITAAGPDREILLRCEQWAQDALPLKGQGGMPYTKFLDYHELFIDNILPFVKAAEEERAIFEGESFLRFEPFSELTGPNNLFLFAPRGYGKSAMRLGLSNFIRRGLSLSLRPASKPKPGLVVDINQNMLRTFGATEKGYQTLIVDNVLLELRRRLNAGPRLRSRLNARNDRLVRFLALEQLFRGSSINVPEEFVQYTEHITNQVSQYTFDRDRGMGLDYFFGELRAIAEQLDFSAIYLVLDNLDDVWDDNYPLELVQLVLQHIIRSGIPASLASDVGDYENLTMRVVWKFFLHDRFVPVIEDLTSTMRSYVRFYRLPKRTSQQLIDIIDAQLTYYATVLLETISAARSGCAICATKMLTTSY